MTRTLTVRRLAGLAVAALAIYVGIDAALHLLPPHYDAVAQPESDYAIGPYGWLMTLNFVLRGLLSLATIEALRRALPENARSRLGLGFLAVWAVGAFVLAAFPTDLNPTHATTHGTVHVATAFVAFLAASLGELRLSLALRHTDALEDYWKPLTGLAALSLLVFAVLVVGVAGARLTGIPAAIWSVFGLVERVFLACVLGWLLAVAARLATTK